MFANNNNNKKDEGGQSTKVKTIFGKGTKIIGDLKTKGSVRVEGEITGKVEANGDVFIGESGKIETKVEARKVVIAGEVEADIVAYDKLEILKQGILRGDIKCNHLVIEEGATFIGNSDKIDEDKLKEKRTRKAVNKKRESYKNREKNTKKQKQNNGKDK